ncbi:hypothetical protein FAY30_20880 [Bacillus sp. S3]|uniref:GAP1-N2 domain-containing protein n=1 Tax=Bacillus sp. S3 TaxID=486398 RepID=UPI00118B82F6|nr:hypothetical protein [Bacillus sp. S3]QCJ44162.1 hypothetical protein FAY30_20880 [Bacillus sp. S3]
MSEKIEQQLYTRERGGIFHATDGYDTIAISEGLDHGFVKKILHPFCLYHPPKTLTERGEKDADRYPKAVTFFQPESGELVIGQAVFVPADFTGQRSTYFIHHFIIPNSLKDEWLKQPEKLFHMNGFQTSYNSGRGKVLPQMDAVDYAVRDISFNQNEILTSLKISEEHFKQVLYAVMASISGKRKVFISLDVPIEEYSKSALRLLELIFQYLPYEYRRKLGSLTFTSKPEAKNGIHVVFYEPGTLPVENRFLKNQYIFEFAMDRISGADVIAEHHTFVNHAFHHFSESRHANDFFAFAEMALSGLADEQKLEPASYDQLTAMYLIIHNNDFSLYKENKLELLQSLRIFLQTDYNKKSALAELFLNLLKDDALLELYLKERLKLAVRAEELLQELSSIPGLLEHSKAALLRSIDLKELTFQDIMLFGEVFRHEPYLPEGKARDIHACLHALYQLLTSPSQAGFINLKPLTLAARYQVREFLQKGLRNNLSPDQFPLLLVAFGTEDDTVDYQAVLDYVIKHHNNKTLLSFIIENAMLVDMELEYRGPLRNYLISHPQSIWEDKTLRKELQSISLTGLNQLLKEVEAETASPVVKFFKKIKASL